MATPTATLQHDWVRWTVQAVGVIVDPFTEASSVVDDPDAPTGEQVACQSCGEPLNDLSAVSVCPGDAPSP
jgi:hypothetical protein